jgi:hypothetical protein
VPSAEGLPLGRQDEEANAVITLNTGQCAIQMFQQGNVLRIVHIWTVEPDPSRGTAILDEDWSFGIQEMYPSVLVEDVGFLFD